MDWQVLRLKKCFGQQDPWHAVTLEFPELRVLVNDLCLIHRENLAEVEEKIARVLGQHVADWPSFSALQLLDLTRGNVG